MHFENFSQWVNFETSSTCFKKTNFFKVRWHRPYIKALKNVEGLVEIIDTFFYKINDCLKLVSSMGYI